MSWRPLQIRIRSREGWWVQTKLTGAAARVSDTQVPASSAGLGGTSVSAIAAVGPWIS